MIFCNLCRSKNAKFVYRSGKSLSITSDLRIWKSGIEVLQCWNCGHVFKDASKITSKLRDIYNSYDLFSEVESKDQAVFLSGRVQSRSSVIVEGIETLCHLTKQGKFLDIGCNTGIFLREFLTKFPTWEGNGYEISEVYKKQLYAIPGFKKFYTGELQEIKEKFDLIVLVHTLEHVINPTFFLKVVRNLLKAEGYLLIQVPDLTKNPFDYLVFEHISHFYPETLSQLLFTTGYKTETASSQLVPKELTFICRKAPIFYKGTQSFTSYLRHSTKYNIKFLKDYEKLVLKVAHRNPLFVFGTAQAGVWTAGLLDCRFDFYLDESPWRIGKKQQDILIKDPKVLKKGDNVILALAPILAKRVQEKWSSSKASFWYPVYRKPLPF